MPETRHNEGLRVERRPDGVCVLVLDRPQRRNALTDELLLALGRELTAIAADPDVRVVILAGADGVFSAGGDFDQIATLGVTSESQVAEGLSQIMRASTLLWALPQPSIAVVDGAAVGAGMSLALACDVRIASPSAMLLPSFIRMGLVPDCGATWLLPRLIGTGAALRMLLEGRPVDAAAAQQLGLVSQVHENPLDQALELAAVFARHPLAAAATKRLLREAADGGLAAAIDHEAVAQAAAFARGEFADNFEIWRSSRIAD
ncbi:enoyl-CoA hydratase-related protein [Nocardia sp. NPDC051756]|uniref:enoyl-CoA hydratase/isomerase family protein n=1 Tax=Nocardia sp. NPDC051756 TaxID=3154751 RepID=UPI003422F9E0